MTRRAKARPRLARAGPGIERSMARVRWLGVAFTVLQFALYRPPPGVDIPIPQLPVGMAVAGALAAVNLVSSLVGRRRGHPTWLGSAGLAVDAGLVMTIVWLFAFDPTSALWALLVIPVLEGAYRRQLPGALGVWAVCTAGYLLREVWAAGHFHYPFEIQSVTYRMGIVLIVAVTSGFLATNLTRQMEAHRAAGRESDRQAGRLRTVVAASRTMSVLDADRVLEAVVDSSLALGFEGAEICVYDEEGGTWSAAYRGNLPHEYARSPQPIASGVAGLVRVRQEVVELADYASWPGAVPEIRAEGYRTVVGVPIWASGHITAALIVGNRRQYPVAGNELECLELLAAQAGAALSNVRLLEQMKHQAMHDSLTGLPNRVLFEDRVNQALARAMRTGERVALFFLDIDRFKKVNDSFGHAEGNELLRQVAGRLRRTVRQGDTVARMGGDEFTLLLPGLTETWATTRTVEKILDVFSAPFTLGDHQLFVTASVGVAVYPDDGQLHDSLLRAADVAMYRAKDRGRNGFQLYQSGLDTGSRARLALEADLHHAIERDELRVMYQPQVDLHSGRVVVVEALVRWQHSRLGLIAADSIIPLAEEAGLVTAIDGWVLQKACQQAQRWIDDGLPPIAVAVNVSGRQFQDPDMQHAVRAALADSGIPASLLELEVTERVTAEEVAGSLAALAELRLDGVAVAIDDFGTGYSMLSRLRDFPIDKLKIDKSFIREITPAGDAPIVAAAIAMGHSLGLRVVAEGVETPEQLAFLRRHGCDLAQGYLFSKPGTADEVAEMMREPLAAAAAVPVAVA